MVEENNIVDEANKAAERLEKANEANKETLKRMEAIQSREILGGKTSAGSPQKVEVVETPQEYAHRMLRGGK